MRRVHVGPVAEIPHLPPLRDPLGHEDHGLPEGQWSQERKLEARRLGSGSWKLHQRVRGRQHDRASPEVIEHAE